MFLRVVDESEVDLIYYRFGTANYSQYIHRFYIDELIGGSNYSYECVCNDSNASVSPFKVGPFYFTLPYQ